jgi:putative transposase
MATFATRVPALEETVSTTVWFRRWRLEGRWERLNAELRQRLRWHLVAGTPTPAQGPSGLPVAQDHGSGRHRAWRVGGTERGFDPAKKVEGTKRHLLVDTEGLVLKAKVHSAKVPYPRMA